ncbi:MAG: hypothetical protein OXC99_06505 [Chloroflexi bacterium]|nr:hypothetical protein [Chloroflexota bacterium]
MSWFQKSGWVAAGLIVAFWFGVVVVQGAGWELPAVVAAGEGEEPMPRRLA